jgi:hypothetical protein
MLNLCSNLFGSLPAAPPFPDRDLRQRFDRALSRAVVDPAYAEILLDDPTQPVGSTSISSSDYLELKNIRADSLQDFACQLRAVFWPPDLDPTVGPARYRRVAERHDVSVQSRPSPYAVPMWPARAIDEMRSLPACSGSTLTTTPTTGRWA